MSVPPPRAEGAFPSAPVRPKRTLSLKQRQALWAYSFLLVPLAFFVIVRFVPTLTAFRMSLFDWNTVGTEHPFVGFENYTRLASDATFGRALRNTAFYALIGVPAQIALGLGIALLLSRITALRGLLRALYFIPYVTPIVAATWVWQWLLSPQFGPVNTVLVTLGLPAQSFLTSPDQALPSATALVVWQNLGFQVVLFLAGLAAIPRSYYEAASLDGANGWYTFRRITFPLLNPTIVFSVVTGTIAYLQLFTQIVNLNFTDQGGPLQSTLTVAVYIYQVAFGRFQMGYASALTVVLFAIILVITLLQMRFLTRRFDY
ncbi:carbohydrate ABC transporter permease [Deinococcus yavapaiensis]|uniref:Carbohydrate ABC transporter membrane protein 1 (CUT1 family) n=1 Tax=Deinococcus yavapaiensis KR-236 TaxID=694435 RepID=A0A318S6R0_9DEIO|nr:sugar ABC transporter permease [Deinococcus yavapaiensis]PYE50421.1 carbohydrate ABC transporter membrane protein 1 (CUT1 family) [Deinococcus yavapaiensis KR-236]